MRRIALLLICLMPVMLQGEDRGLIEDGTFWNRLTYGEKIAFVQGYANGYLSGQGDMASAFHLAGAGEFDHSVANHDKPVDITFETLVDGVNKCYNDFRNSKLDVEQCIDWTVRGVKGESDTDREQYLTGMRRAAATH